MPGVRRFALLRNASLVLAGMLIALLLTRQTSDQAALAGSTDTSTDAQQVRVIADQQTGRTGFDPLSLAEQQQALELARPAISAARGTRADPAQAAVLLVERHEESKQVYQSGGWARRADVFVYDYAQDVLLQAVVNLTAGRVDQLDSVRDVQLPLTSAEHDQALAIALADPTAGPAIRELYRRTTRNDLQNNTQIQVTGLVFRAESMAESSLGKLGCGIQRCAQLLLATSDGVLLNITIYIDLSRRAVLAVQS